MVSVKPGRGAAGTVRIRRHRRSHPGRCQRRMKTRSQLIIISVLRTVLNTMHRMVYPFLSVFARGLGVDRDDLLCPDRAQRGGDLRSAACADLGRARAKTGHAVGVALFTLGTALVALWPGVPTFAAALILGILGQSLFDPAVHAYFGDRVAYERRGTAVAITELAWSVAFIAGVPAMGLLIAKFGWQAPFPVLAVLGLGMLLVLWRVIPHDGRDRQSAPALSNIQSVLRSIPALAGISIALWASAANEMVTLVFGLWLTDSFGMKIAALAGAVRRDRTGGTGGRGAGCHSHRSHRQAAGGGTRIGGQYRRIGPAALDRAHRGRRPGGAVPVLPFL